MKERVKACLMYGTRENGMWQVTAPIHEDLTEQEIRDKMREYNIIICFPNPVDKGVAIVHTRGLKG